MATYRKQEGKRGTTWLVRVRRNGKSYTQTFPTKKMAQEWATTMEHGIIEQAHFPERATPEPALSSHTMGELIDDYTTHMLPQLAPKTQKTHGTLLRWWRRQLEDTLVINMKVP